MKALMTIAWKGDLFNTLTAGWNPECEAVSGFLLALLTTIGIVAMPVSGFWMVIFPLVGLQGSHARSWCQVHVIG